MPRDGGAVERPILPLPRPRDVLRHAGGHNFANGLSAFLFAATGPGAIILAVSTAASLSAAEIESWFLAAYGLGGLCSLFVCLAYRQPCSMGFSIPAIVIVGPALLHFSMGEMIGAYMATGALILLLAATGLVRRATQALPMPIVMAMVAGVFLPFGVRLINIFDGALLMAACMVAAYLLSSSVPSIGRALPPILAALAAGTAVVIFTGGFAPNGALSLDVAQPLFQTPILNIKALTELVIPLTVTVIGIHNTQGFAILRNAGYRPPERIVTWICGGGTVAFGALGCVPTVVTGPANAILNASGDPEWRYVGGMWFGVWFVLFGIFAPFTVAVGLAVPKSFIAVMAGLAMIPVLQSSFVAAFAGRHSMGALVTFLVTVSGLSIFNIGAAFWGLVIGYAVSRLVEPGDFARPAAASEGTNPN